MRVADVAKHGFDGAQAPTILMAALIGVDLAFQLCHIVVRLVGYSTQDERNQPSRRELRIAKTLRTQRARFAVAFSAFELHCVATSQISMLTGFIHPLARRTDRV